MGVGEGKTILWPLGKGLPSGLFVAQGELFEGSDRVFLQRLKVDKFQDR